MTFACTALPALCIVINCQWHRLSKSSPEGRQYMGENTCWNFSDFASSKALPCKVLRTLRSSGQNPKDLSCNQECISFHYISPWALYTVHTENKQIRDLSRQPRMHFSCWDFMYCAHRKQFSRQLSVVYLNRHLCTSFFGICVLHMLSEATSGYNLPYWICVLYKQRTRKKVEFCCKPQPEYNK